MGIYGLDGFAVSLLLWSELRAVQDMKDYDERLSSAVRLQSAPESSRVVKRLGDVLGELMADRIQPGRLRFESVARRLSELLPVELGRHCEITDISAGQLTVLVDSPSHLYELRLCSSELLGQLRVHCPEGKIQKIKFVTG